MNKYYELYKITLVENPNTSMTLGNGCETSSKDQKVTCSQNSLITHLNNYVSIDGLTADLK
jgi:hypothetical protein